MYKQRFTDTVPFYRQQLWYTQPRIYVKPLSYTSVNVKMVPGRDFTSNAKSGVMSFESHPLWYRESLKTKAYEKFRDKLLEFSMVAVNYAERRQAVNALAQRLDGAAMLLSNIRRRRWKAIARSAKRNGKNWNKTFLEFHFGWIPLVNDVYNATEAILKPPTSQYLRASSTSTRKVTLVNGYYRNERSTTDSCVIRGRVEILNSNLVLLNQLGLLNPASIAWELVPFSFVLDWFANINTVLSQFSDFAGIDTSRVSHTIRTLGTQSEYYVSPYNWFGPVWTSFYLVRSPGLPIILPTIKPFNGFSVVRGTTAIALLLNRSSPFTSLFSKKS